MTKDRILARTSLCIEPEQLDRLRAISERTGVPVARMIRTAIDAYLAGRRGRPTDPASPDQHTSEA